MNPPGNPPKLPAMYCTACGATAAACQCEPGVRHLAPVPVKPRSVVGTTLLVLLTVFVIAPILLVGGCQALFGTGSHSTPSEPASAGNPYHWPSEGSS